MPAAGPQDASFGLIHGLHWLCANLADEQPLLVLVDDAHWVDRPTLRFLAYLGARCPDMALLLVIGMRTGEPAAVDEPLAVLRDAPSTIRLAPGALTGAAVTEIVAGSLGRAPDADFCEACGRVSAGNPFLLGELIAELRDDGVAPTRSAVRHVESVRPTSVARAVLARLGRLGDDAQRLAAAVAVLERCELHDAAELAGLESGAARGAADRLFTAEILAAPPRVRFLHPLLRHAVYEAIPPAQRADDHRRAALLLDRRGVRGSTLGGHLLRAEASGDSLIVELCRRTAADALPTGEPSGAAALLRRALAEPAPDELRGQLLAEIGEAEALARDPAAVGHLREALDHAPAPAVRVRVVSTLAQWLVWNGESSDAYALVTRTLEELGPTAGHELRVVLETLRTGIGSVSREHIELIGGRLDELHELAVRAGDSGAALLIAEGCVRAQRRHWTGEWRQLLDRGLGDGRYVKHYSGSSPIIDFAAICLVHGDEVAGARRLLDEVRADAVARGSIHAHLNAIAWGAVLALRRGRLSQAEDDGRNALALAGRHHVLWTVLWASATLTAALCERGEIEAAERVIAAAPLEQAPGSSPWLHATVARARLRVIQGRAPEAAVDLRAVGAATIIDNPSYVPWRSALAAALGPGEEAAALADAELARARALGQPRGIAGALRAVAAAGECAEPVVALAEAVTLLRGSPARLELARTLCDLGAAERRRGERVAAREPLREAAEIARECGAVPLAERTREELRAAGARPRRDRFAGPEALTPSELRVAELAIAGLTNREIAQSLFVTTKTVGTHLGHIYGKLGLQGPQARDQLACTLRGG
jgi:DNA-binding CsgD family transcriptional regulator